MGKIECFYLQFGDYVHVLLSFFFFFLFYIDTFLKNDFSCWLSFSGLDSVV